jgi:RecB family endonuclease NucS
LFSLCGLNSLQAEDFEVLGEKALPEGQIDLLIKDRTPAGYARKIIVEVKLGKVEGRDIVQLRNYIFKAGEECILGILIAGECSKTVRREAESQMIKCFTYRFGKIFTEERYSLEDLRSRFQIF